MQPKFVSCNKCHANIRLFTKVPPDACPQCKTQFRVEEFSKCTVCSARVELGTERCDSCKMSNPSFSTYPSTAGTGSGVN